MIESQIARGAEQERLERDDGLLARGDGDAHIGVLRQILRRLAVADDAQQHPDQRAALIEVDLVENFRLGGESHAASLGRAVWRLVWAATALSFGRSGSISSAFENGYQSAVAAATPVAASVKSNCSLARRA